MSVPATFTAFAWRAPCPCSSSFPCTSIPDPRARPSTPPACCCRRPADTSTVLGSERRPELLEHRCAAPWVLDHPPVPHPVELDDLGPGALRAGAGAGGGEEGI